MAAAEDERAGAVEGVDQAAALCDENALGEPRQARRTERRSTARRRSPSAGRSGTASVSGSACTRPRNTTAPRSARDEDRRDLPERARVEERDRRRRDGDAAPCSGPRASVRAIAITAVRTTAAAASSSPCTQPAPARSTFARPERERREDDGRGQREAEPGGETAELAGPVHADRDPDLARRRAGQDVRERDELAELLLTDPPAARDVLVVEVADVGDRARRRTSARGAVRRERPRRRSLSTADAPGFQSGSSAPASALAARARMNRRSERRLR